MFASIMGQLTLVRFRVRVDNSPVIHPHSREVTLQGDTSAGLVSRVLGTLFGVFVGAGLWFEFRL